MRAIFILLEAIRISHPEIANLEAVSDCQVDLVQGTESEYHAEPQSAACKRAIR